MRKTVSLLLFVLLTTFSMQAKHISSTQALQLTFNKTTCKAVRAKSLSNYQLAYSTDGLYAFNNRGNGFILLAADDCLPDLVLGYSDNGNFDYATMPDGLKDLLYEMSEEVKIIASIQEKYPNFASENFNEVLSPIEPLITSHWNQNAPYNLMNPTTSDGGHYNAGCISTAMSQIMYFHKWPKHGNGSHSYTWTIDTNTGEECTLSADFSQSTYDWENMLNSYDNNSTDIQKNAVAKLLIDTGISVETWYRSGNSSGFSDRVGTSLVSYFDYNQTLSFIHRAYYTKYEWRDILYSNLSQGLPIYYRGKTQKNAGHAFICDGYKDGLFHINWGWGGMSDGYFQIALLNPAEQGLGGSTGGYQCDQKALIGIRPHYNDDVTCLMYCTDAFYSGSPSTTIRKTATFYGKFESETCCDRTYTLGIKVVSPDGNVQYSLSTSKPDNVFSYGESLMNISIPLSDLNLVAGTYIVTPAYLDVATKTWYDMRVLLTQDETSLIMTVDDNGKVTFTAPTITHDLKVTDILPKHKVIVGYDADIDFSVTCATGDYLNNVCAALLESGTSTVAVKSNSILIDVAEGEELSYSVTMTPPTTTGTYDLVLLDYRGNVVSDRTSITVEAAPTSKLSIKGTLSPMSSTMAMNDLEFNLSLKCSGGVFNSQPTIWVYDTNFTNVGSITTSEKSFLVEGEESQFYYKGSLELNSGQLYYAYAYYIGSSNKWVQLSSCSFYAAEADGIENINAITNANTNAIYNLNGVRMNSENLPKGIYIINGKKVIK